MIHPTAFWLIGSPVSLAPHSFKRVVGLYKGIPEPFAYAVPAEEFTSEMAAYLSDGLGEETGLFVAARNPHAALMRLDTFAEVSRGLFVRVDPRNTRDWTYDPAERDFWGYFADAPLVCNV